MLQYRGFAVSAEGRQYSFAVSQKDLSERAFTMFVPHAAFGPGRLSYQEGPQACYRKMTCELATEALDSPLCGQQRLTESDVVNYKESRPSKSPAVKRRSSFQPR
jgi:hypothetical protein